jgi:phosphatidylserine/phosphatidylglycerophosphate/cardiolipin synthase-like enzyme
MPDESSMPLAVDDERATAAGRRMRRRWIRRVIMVALATLWAGTAWFNTSKPLPGGVRTASAWQDVPVANVHFLRDLTAADAYGRPVIDQQIFDRTLALIAGARQFIVADYFLFNDQQLDTATNPPLRALARELREALIQRKLAQPELRVLVITDPINDVYGGDPSPGLAALRAAGVDVVLTNLDRLPDSNPLYSSLWRLTISWWGSDGRGAGWLPNPLEVGPSDVTFRAWARLLNLKANHRKVLIADDGADGLAGIVTSANPHDASSAHSNVALEIQSPALEPLLRSELSIARFSNWVGFFEPPHLAAVPAARPGDFLTGRSVRLQVLTEGAIRTALIERIDAAARGESIDIAMFYVSERSVVEALRAAAARGVAVRLLLDPNKDAFGREKSGMPNRQVATELLAASDGAIKVRWYRTHGEQFHSKLVAIYGAQRVWFTLGSANLTRRNIDDYNLEANLAVEAARAAPPAAAVLAWYDTIWNNRAPAGIEYSAPYDLYADPSQGRYWLYRLMEATGLSSF